jgi:hypothetical protein
MSEDTMAKEFDSLQNKITNLFRPIFDPMDEFFIELISKFKIAGVDFLEVNNFKKTAIAKHSNYYEYPERRYAVVVNDKNKVKFYELEFKSDDVDNKAKEVSQQEFEQLTIPTYLKPNPLLSKEDSEEDKEPEQSDTEGTKVKKDKEALSQVDEEPKKMLNYGETSSPKIKEDLDKNEATEKPIIDASDTQGYTGNEGNLGPLESDDKNEASSLGFTDEYERIADENRLMGKVRDAFIQYMKTRWPKGEAEYYIIDWAKRFKKRSAYSRSDGSGREVLKKLGISIDKETMDDVYSAEEEMEDESYTVEFINKNDKKQKVVVEAIDARSAGVKVFNLGAKKVISAEKKKNEKK